VNIKEQDPIIILPAETSCGGPVTRNTFQKDKKDPSTYVLDYLT
jgi:hypothetical protein